MTEPGSTAPAHSTEHREHDLLLEDLHAEIAAYRRRLATTEAALGALCVGDEQLAGDALARAVHRFQEYAARHLAVLAEQPARHSPDQQSGPRQHPGH